MYVTRPLSLYRRDPSAASSPPPEGPNSGILVIQDEEAQPTSCFGLCNSSQVKDLPFPQNKNLQVRYTSQAVNYVVFIPALGQPLSSNRYYVINRRGNHKGYREAYANSTEEEMTTCCFFRCIKDKKPEPFKPQGHDMIYHQFQISLHKSWGGGHSFNAKSVATNGFPPHFLRRNGWRLHTSTPREFELGEALGLDSKLRAQLPDFTFPLSDDDHHKVVVAGKWYCPFMFVKESGMKVKDQVIHSRFYEMTMEQQWEPIFRCDASEGGHEHVNVDVEVESEGVRVGKRDAVGDRGEVDADGVIWFTSVHGGETVRHKTTSVGLSKVIVERMKWEEERVGWRKNAAAGLVRLMKRVEFEGGAVKIWKRFGYFVLVERFVLRRIDGSFLMSYEFKHLHQFRTKWE
ncbi:hypothetical protein LINPERPRIM_LOCUS23052 [Linum perenne]